MYNFTIITFHWWNFDCFQSFVLLWKIRKTSTICLNHCLSPQFFSSSVSTQTPAHPSWHPLKYLLSGMAEGSRAKIKVALRCWLHKESLLLCYEWAFTRSKISQTCKTFLAFKRLTVNLPSYRFSKIGFVRKPVTKLGVDSHYEMPVHILQKISSLFWKVLHVNHLNFLQTIERVLL